MSSTALVDAHCHFDLFRNPQQVIQEAERNRIHSIAVTNTPSVFDPMRQLTRGLTYVHPALGLHPELAIQRASEMPIFQRKLPDTRYVGEVGLDYKVVVKPAERAKQRAIFQSILRRCANAGGRILTIHSRRAEADVVAAVSEYQPGPFILHWYSGSLKTLAVALAAGAFFSVNAAMVRSKRGRRLIQEIPLDRVLTESDGPFVLLDGQPAGPSSVGNVVRELARIRGADLEQVRESVLANLKALWHATPQRPLA